MIWVTRSHPLDRALSHVLPYLNFSSMVALACSSKAACSWLLSAIEMQGVMFLELPSDEACSSSVSTSILSAARRLRIILGAELSDIGCESLRKALERVTNGSIEIDVRKCSQITQSGLDRIFEYGGFSSISLQGLWRIGDATIRQIAKRSTGALKQLDLSRCYRLNDSSVRDLHGLRILNLERCANVTESETLRILAQNNPKLGELNLASMSALVTDETFAMLPVMKNLEKLNIEGAHKLTSKGLRELTRATPNLRWLSLARCTALTSLDPLLFTTQRNLRYLNLNGCQVLRRSDCDLLLCGAIEDLDLRQTDLCNRSLKAILNLPNLRVLAMGCTSITDQGLAHFTASIAEIETISLDGCLNVTVEGMAALFESKGRSLKSVRLPQSSDDRTLKMMSMTCHVLQEVDFGKSPRVTSEGVIDILQRCGDTIKVLRLDETNVDDKALSCIPGLARLERLTLYGCAKVSDEAIAQLDKVMGPHLKTIRDRDGRMLRCVCCPLSTRRALTCTASNSPNKTEMRSALSQDSDLVRFLTVEAPMVALSCVALFADWYFS